MADSGQNQRQPGKPGLLAVLWRLFRSGLGGLFATFADLATLELLVRGFGATPDLASVPALVVSNLVMYFAQKRIAFDGSGGAVKQEAGRFVLVQAGGFALIAGLYELAMRMVPGASDAYVLTRLVVTNLVFLFYSFPLWHWVFKRPARAQAPD